MSFIGPRRALLSKPYDADLVAWRRAVFTAGGTVSPLQLGRVSTLIRSLKAAGVWARRDDYAAYCAENQTQALVTLKKRITQTLAHASTINATFVANRGFLGNRDGYINTGWNPTTLGNYARDDAGWGFHCYSAPTTANDRFMASDTTGDTNEAIYSATNITWDINSVALIGYAHGGVLTGLYQLNRTASNAITANQSNVQKQSAATASAALVSQNFFALAGNVANAPFLPTDAGLSLAFAGGSLTVAQLSAEYTALRAFLTAMGVP